MPPKASSFHRLMTCRCLLLSFFWFHTGTVVFGAEFTFCGYLHHSINKSHHHIEPGLGPCSLKVSIKQTGLEIKAHLIENDPPISMEDIAATTPNALSDVCITWKGHVGKLFITRGDVVKSYSTAMSTKRKCCQNFILTKSTSSNSSPLLSDIIYINGSNFSPVHIENASSLEFTGSEGACETPWSDCMKQKDKLTQLAGAFNLNDARYAVLITSGILEECNASISAGLESYLRNVLMNMDFPEDSKTFVTPNVKATVIKVDQESKFHFIVSTNFSWVGPDDQTVIAAVRVKLPYRVDTSLKAVVTQFKKKTSFQVGPDNQTTIAAVQFNMTSELWDESPSKNKTPFQPDSTMCAFLDSGHKDPWNQTGCNIEKGDNNITCRCDRLGFFFAVTLESKDSDEDDPIKVTTSSNHPNNVNVTTTVADMPCETSLESTTSISSSTGPNQTCNYLRCQLISIVGNERHLEAATIVDTLIQRCLDQIPNIASIPFILENIFMEGDFKGQSKVGETENIIFYILKIDIENFTGVQFPNSDTGNLSTLDPAITIKLPPTLLHNISNHFNTTTSRIIVTIYRNAALFQDKNQSIILNNVIGIRVGNTSIDHLTDPVIIVFNKTSSEKFITKCVFWELEQNENTSIGHWNDSGCTTENTDNQTICRCNHLTFFAVLLQIDGSQPLDEEILKSLTYITQIGCGVSAIFTAITVILHFILRKRQKEFSLQIHVNLSAALFLLNVNFLTNPWLSSINIDSLCKAIAVFLHYSLLCSFTWMGIEAFHLYIMLVKVFNTYIKRYMLKLCLVGWAFPAVVLLIVIGVSTDNYGRYSILVNTNYSSTVMCWITNKTVHYVTNVAYFILIFLGNTILLIILCVKVIRLNGGNKKSIFTVIGLTCLLGTTYGTALFSYGPMSIPAMYMFCILNPLQGFFIFVWYCMLTRSSSTTDSKTSKTSKSATANEYN